jgi:hypothetical protein
VVFRSLNRGDNWQVISPDITLTPHGSGTALSESPLNADVLYAGSDDGGLWMTRDGGKNWTNLTKNVALAGPRCVASIEASRFSAGRAYVAFDGHRSDDDDPIVWVTEDFGVTWKSLKANLPMGSSRVLREDIENQNLLLLGTEFGAWCSLDRGRHWNRFATNFPTVAVRVPSGERPDCRRDAWPQLVGHGRLSAPSDSAREPDGQTGPLSTRQRREMARRTLARHHEPQIHRHECGQWRSNLLFPREEGRKPFIEGG